MKKKKYRSFTKARKFVRSLKLKNQKEWNEYCKSGKKPDDIPLHPDRVYPKEFTILGDWLGTGRISNQEKSKSWLSYDKASDACKKAGIKTQNEFEEASKNGTLPKGVPTHPEKTYKGKGWIDLGTFLGTGNKYNPKRKYWPYERSRDYVQKLKLKNEDEWREYCKSGKLPTEIPQNPAREYKKEWKDLGDWLGTGRISNQEKSKSFLPLIEAKILARKVAKELGIKTMKDWEVAYQSGKIPSTLPSSLFQVYAKRRRKM
uniref:Uncharacterized protein n=1 Tax=uncultured marine thaumarchaeote KM3_85_E11 TaxID=1456317 RepID=A0A075HRY6_9ARCH|nr:hypothetical protein [uncultured marine thaumarchaeote KM3_85_E11]